MGLMVDVELTDQDFRAFCKAAYRYSKSLPTPDVGRHRLVFGLLFVIAVLVDLAAIRLVDGSLAEHFLFASLVSLTFLVFVFYFQLRARRQMQPDETGSVLGRKSYELTDAGIVERTPHSESMFRWSGVRAVDETPEHLFLFIDRCAAYIIPKRSFLSLDRASDFVAFAESHIKLGGQ